METVYVHYDGSVLSGEKEGLTFELCVPSFESTTVADAILGFLEEYAERRGEKGCDTAARAKKLKAKDWKGIELGGAETLQDAVSAIQNDVFLTDREAVQKEERAAKEVVEKEIDDEEIDDEKIDDEERVVILMTEEEQKEMLEVIQKDIDGGFFGTAKDRCSVLIAKGDSKHHIDLAKCYLGKALLGCKQVERAREEAERVSRFLQNTWQLHDLLGDINMAEGDMEEAVDEFSRAITLLRGKDKSELKIECGEKVMRRSVIQVKKAKCLINLRRQPEAFEIIDSTMNQADSKGNIDGALLNASCFISHGEFESGVKMLLLVVTSNPNAKAARQEFARLCLTRQKEVLNAIKEVLASLGNATKSNVYAFLGKAAQEYSAIAAGNELLKEACAISPEIPNYTLSFVHLLELDGKFQQCFQELKRAFLAAPSQYRSEIASTCSIAATMCNVALATFNGKGGVVEKQHQYTLEIEKPRSEEERVIAKSVFPDSEAEAVGFSPSPTNLESNPSPYTPEELDMIGLIFTFVKLLYQQSLDTIRLLPPILAHAEPLRTKRDLHLSTIRNEHAYFQMVKYLLGSQKELLNISGTVENGDKPKINKIYVFGDSHTFPLAWRRVQLGSDKDYVLVPKLATGVKIWHMRPGNTFYPAYQFEKVAETIPDGSEVLMLFGEIDCREGLLLAVEKGCYDTVREAVAELVKIYIAKLLELTRKRHWKIYIHPIAPALNVTRHLVVEFSRQFEKAIQNYPELHYLDFFLDLLEEAEAATVSPDLRVNLKLKDEFHLDGTHLNPMYIHLLEKSLRKIC